MKQRIINERREYTAEQITNQGLAPLFRIFETKFREYASQRLGEEAKHNAPNFNRYIGYLERACHAAETLGSQYNLGIGIAKKGLWLSYVFSLYGLSTYDILIVRTEKNDRFSRPLTPLFKKDVQRKKIIIFDNDLVTGKTVERIAQGMLDAGAQQTDLLLTYGNTRLSYEYYKQIIPYFKHKSKTVGKTPAGEIVVNTETEIPNTITHSFSLEKDFTPSSKHLAKLAKILGVEIDER